MHDDVRIRRVIEMVDLEASTTYIVSDHEESSEWARLEVNNDGGPIMIRKEALVRLAKTVLKVYN